MSEFKNIVVATDFSDISDRALDKAAALAKQLSARLHVVHIVQIHPTNMPESGNVNIKELEELEERNANENLSKDLEERCQGIDVAIHVMHGNPAAQVNAVAKETGADLIVMGTHGRSGFAHLIMGSVAKVY